MNDALRGGCLGLALCVQLLLLGGTVDAATPDSTKAAAKATPADVKVHPPVPHLLTRGDLIFLGATLGGVATAAANDRWLTSKAADVEGNVNQRRAAQFFQPLGNFAYVVPVTLGTYGIARWARHPQLARRSVRVLLSLALANGATLGLKEAVGRSRPFEAPDQPHEFKPFSGHDSFPSGHAATAFAVAVALDRETTGRWIPWVAYPAATMVAWSRVHDSKHWTSDVVAGSAVGAWIAWKTEDFLAHRALGVAPTGGAPKTSLLIAPRRGALELVVTRRFN
jgi:PAP2 superfamily